MTNFIIRNAEITDAAALAEIYAPYVENTCISFEDIAPDEKEFACRIKAISEIYPFLVCETKDGIIAGYTYASAHGTRAGYKYTANASIYLNKKFHRMGAGRALYNKLFELLLKQNIYTVFASVSSENPESIYFHKGMGFKEAGCFKNIGYKYGKWLDLTWLQLSLRDYDNPENQLEATEASVMDAVN